LSRLIILGTANAISDEEHENTHMALRSKEHLVLIDCVNNPFIHLRRAGLNVIQLNDLILTHFHPDHVSGVPTLLMNSWLLGRKAPLNIYGLADTLDRLEQLLDAYDWTSWPNFFPVHFKRLPEEEMALVLSNEEFRLYTSPVHHLVPGIGLRIEFLHSGQTIAYSGDTEPCPQVIHLAERADILIHEATGAHPGHTSAAQAGVIARQAGVASLYLIHYQTTTLNLESLVSEATGTFNGPVTLTRDFMELEL
jgi:ribonuclease Z